MQRANERMPKNPFRGRGTPSNPPNRYDAHWVESADDGWGRETEDCAPHTELLVDTSRSVLCFNRSPDVPFDRSINPYRGCEHGCVYCFARPTHAYLGFSPGLDFETRILYKPRAADLLRRELSRPTYCCRPLALGANTDAYQPVERLAQAAVPVGVLVAPVIPGLTDHEMEQILVQARSAGAESADFVLLRLPREINGLFQDWLKTHWPLRATRVMQQIRDCRGGQENDPRFGHRMRGNGIIAQLLEQRFRLASRRLGYGAAPSLETRLFRSPGANGMQMSLL